MKKTAGFLILVAALFFLKGTALAEDIPVDAAHFPDENFQKFMGENFDKDGNNVLSENERDNAKTIYDVE